MKRPVSRAQQRIVGPLDDAERTQLGLLLGKLVGWNEAAGRPEDEKNDWALLVPSSKRKASKKEAF